LSVDLKRGQSVLKQVDCWCIFSKTFATRSVNLFEMWGEIDRMKGGS